MRPSWIWVVFGILAVTGMADELPVVPVGFDAYRMWDRWAQQRIGVRAYMRSTYDRRGGNEAADASHFLYQLADDFNVTLDVEGRGVLYFARYNHWHGSPWHYLVDGHDFVIRETSTADPDHPVANSVFVPEKAFPRPLSWTWSLTQGADLMWVPIPFERSFQMAYSRTRYGTGYYIYHLFVEGIPLSRPIRSWTAEAPAASDVLRLLARSGEDPVDPVTRADSPRGGRLTLEERTGMLRLPPKESVVFLDRGQGPAIIRALELSAPKEQAVEFGRARLRVTWDGRAEPSIEAPVALFFGTGTLYNRDQREYLVKGFPIHVRFDERAVHLACYFPMPFFRSARLELIGAENPIADVRWLVRSAPYTGPANHVAYFHATHRDFARPEPGQDLVLLDSRQTEGGVDWSGHFVGTSWTF